ncbi:hypothetical protein HK100_012048 [Physocladia obscura]|uniref:N-acetyltransferase domain-containing protein n=1 Tax=Physocladia obscura TaxID=109957 RepID=A0AAD5T397_9FUNG|nr:hypothetical protein HK100_012048 [Physocladia obscura]
MCKSCHNMFSVVVATTIEQVKQIKALQMENLRRLLPVETQLRDGFVTAEYTQEYLEQLHAESPAIIALDEAGHVVGYVLAVTRSTAAHHSLLADLAEKVDSDRIVDSNSQNNYILVGQLCVAKHARGHSLAGRMYDVYRAEYKRRGFYCAVTDVADDNQISMNVHKKAGWIVAKSITFESVSFSIVILPF